MAGPFSNPPVAPISSSLFSFFFVPALKQQHPSVVIIVVLHQEGLHLIIIILSMLIISKSSKLLSRSMKTSFVWQVGWEFKPMLYAYESSSNKSSSFLSLLSGEIGQSLVDRNEYLENKLRLMTAETDALKADVANHTEELETVRGNESILIQNIQSI